MFIAAIFLANAVLSFALSLWLASSLGPAAFGRYAVAVAVVVLVNAALFDWLRLSTTRFYSERSRRERPQIRRTLDRAYAAMACLVAALAGLALLLDPGWPAYLVVATALGGVAYAASEYGIALSRARFLDRPLAVLGLGRAVLAFVFAGGAAALGGGPALAVAGSALAAALAWLAARPMLADPAPEAAAADGALVAAFGRYALPIVAAGALYGLLPLANRALLAHRTGFAAAGELALAGEIAARLFQNLGAALDLALFQLAVRTHERRGRAAAERRIARNAALVAAIVLPAATGLVAVWPHFEAVFVPAAFAGRLAGPALLLIPAYALFALAQFALGPYCQIRGATVPVVVAAAVAVAVDLALVLAWPGLDGASGFAAAQLAGLAAAALVLALVVVGMGARLPWRAFGQALAGSVVMAAALWPLRNLGAPAVSLAVQVAAGLAIYGALALACDLAGARAAWRRLRRRWHGRRTSRPARKQVPGREP